MASIFRRGALLAGVMLVAAMTGCAVAPPAAAQPVTENTLPGGFYDASQRTQVPPAPLVLIGRDSITNHWCVVGATSTCVSPISGGGGGGGAAYGPDAATTPSTRPPLQMGGLDSSGNVQNWYVDGLGLGHTYVSNLFGLEGTQQSVLAALTSLVNAIGSSIPGGSAIIGKFGIDQTSDGTTNAVHLLAGSALAGKFAIDQTTLGNTNGVTIVPATTGGASSYTFEVAASDNHQNIKNGAGTIYTLDGFSIATAAMFIRLYDAGTGFNGCNSATNLLWEGQIPGPGTTGGGFAKSWGDVGKAFTNGLSVCVTGAFGNTNTTSATASVASVNVGYK